MDVNNSANVGDSDHNNKAKEINSQSDHVNVNGLNGYSSEKHKSHKSEHKDKHRDRDRDRERSKDHKSSSKDKDRHSSSKDKDRHSSHKSSSKDKDRDREKDRSDRDKDHKDRGDRDKHRDKHRDDKKSSSKDKDREHKSSRDKEHKSSSSSKDKEGRDKDKDRDREKDKERRDKDKHRHSSSKDKDRHSSSKDKHRDKERDKDRHSSSKDKDRKEKEREKKAEKEKIKEEKKIKEEVDAETKYDSAQDSVDEDDQKLVIKEEPDSQDESEDKQNLSQVSQASSCDYSLSQFKDEPRYADEEEDDSQQGEDDSRMVDSQIDENQIKEESDGGEDDDEDYKPEIKKATVKEEPADEDSDEDMPLSSSYKHKLAARMDKSNSSLKRKIESDDDDDVPLISRKKVKKEKKEKKKKKIESDYEDEADDYKPIKKKEKKEKEKKKIKKEAPVEVVSPKKGRKKKEEDEQEVWKWWEETKREDGVKWTFLEHKGPVFAPPYEPIPKDIKFYYDGKEMELSEPAEEIAGFYAKMLEHDYTSKDAFNKNFFSDWRKHMTERERKIITDLEKCNFKRMHAYFMDLSEKNKNRTKEEKLALKEKNEELLKEYGFCKIDGHKEKIGNFKIEPPGLFRGRGEHPKMGKLKKRVEAEDVIINCSKDSQIPEPPPGHKWKEVRHDPSVTWLASWTENVQNQVKYVMLNPSSKLKGEKDWQKYETARRLHKCIDKIRQDYKEDWKSKEMRIRQRAVALYFIDRLALRAGNEKDEDQADTVGCCSLRVEHIELHEKKDDRNYVVVFDFLGKDSIRYYNEVPVEKRVFKNLQIFMENKRPGDDLFDRLTTQIMNKHLNELMEGLTAKVFRTYNASWTLQQQLNELTNADDTVAEKILSYNRANRAVAILCNHQRSVPKGHEKSMEKLKEKIDQKKEQIRDAERQVKDAEKDARRGSVKEKVLYDKKKKMLQKMKEQLTKLEIQETDRDENKTIALGTSKLNYLDPRISVAWCKKYNVPIEKIYNKTQRDKFRWAIDMAGPEYEF